MKSLLILLVLAPLGLGATACDGTSKSTTSHAIAGDRLSQVWRERDKDKDNDITAFGDDTNNNSVIDFGHAANAVTEQAITVLVKSYYTAALTGDGAKACSMIYSTFAEAIAEDYGEKSAGPAYMRGTKTCPTALSRLFQHFHSELAVEDPILRVTAVRFNHGRGLVVLGFGRLPERQIAVERERRRWKIDALLDSELP